MTEDLPETLEEAHETIIMLRDLVDRSSAILAKAVPGHKAIEAFYTKLGRDTVHALLDGEMVAVPAQKQVCNEICVIAAATKERK